MLMRNLVIEGKFVRLEELQPKHFEYVIKWRNNPERNRYLNQPFKLTMENQTKWYEDVYLKDNSQILFVMVDAKRNIPFGTTGWTDYDGTTCEVGRLLVGDNRYNGSKEFMEATLLFNDYLHRSLKLEIVYAHIATENKASISWTKHWGYVSNNLNIKYHDRMLINNLQHEEFVRTCADYSKVRTRIEKLIKLFK